MIARTWDGVTEAPEPPSGEAAALADEVHRIAEGDPWHGPSLAELLEGISSDQASAHPLAGGHSVWELVLHVAAWVDVGRRRLEGQAVEEPEAGDYPPVGPRTAEGWEAAKADLMSGLRRLRDSVARLTAAELDSPTPGRPFPRRFQVGSSVRHVVYHSGQIGILKRALQLPPRLIQR
jgi:hypothetical protein